MLQSVGLTCRRLRDRRAGVAQVSAALQDQRALEARRGGVRLEALRGGGGAERRAQVAGADVGLARRGSPRSRRTGSRSRPWREPPAPRARRVGQPPARRPSARRRGRARRPGSRPPAAARRAPPPPAATPSRTRPPCRTRSAPRSPRPGPRAPGPAPAAPAPRRRPSSRSRNATISAPPSTPGLGERLEIQRVRVADELVDRAVLRPVELERPGPIPISGLLSNACTAATQYWYRWLPAAVPRRE